MGADKHKETLDRFGIKRPLRSLIFPGRLQQAFRHNWFGPTGPEHSGLYRARMQVSGIRPKDGQIAHLRIGKMTFEAANEGLIEIDVVAPEDEPEVPSPSGEWRVASGEWQKFFSLVFSFPTPESLSINA